jgi:hypothetical protein
MHLLEKVCKYSCVVQFFFEFGFAIVGCDWEPVFDEETMHQILNNIDNGIVPLFPGLEDMLGKCILLKVDSGHGCNGYALLNKCWFRGVLHLLQPAQLYLYAAGDRHQQWSV